MEAATTQSSPGPLPIVHAFLRGTSEMAADEVRPIDGGCVLRTPSLPKVWGLNYLRLSAPVTYAQAVELSEEHLGDLPFRHLVIEHEPSAERLEAPLLADGWKVDRELLMALARPADREGDREDDREVAPSAVLEAGAQQVLRLMRRWVSEQQAIGSEERDQVVECTFREGQMRAAQNFGIADDGGEMVAMTKLYSDGTTAQVEDVYTVPEWRGRGCARSLLTRALAVAREADHELVFIVADDDGWPKQLYSRVGFDPIGRMRMFHRDVA